MWKQLLRHRQVLNQFGVEYVLYENKNNPYDFNTPEAKPLSELKDIHPLLNIDSNISNTNSNTNTNTSDLPILGAILTPTDGIVNPADCCMEIARQAKEEGIIYLYINKYYIYYINIYINMYRCYLFGEYSSLWCQRKKIK